jgi:hypothetical protein
LEEESMERSAWFPGDETCRRRDLQAPWIARQRKIDRATRKNIDRGCFTVAMLSHDCRVTRGIRGLDPEKTDITDSAVQRWVKAHPAITAAEREKLRARLITNGAKKGPATPVLSQPMGVPGIPDTETALQQGGAS